MTQIIGIIQVKGGVGRSTIATNLGGVLSRLGPTAIIDCDLPQGTSASWYALRQAEYPAAGLSLGVARDPRELLAQAREFSRTHRYLVIDGPPRLTELTRAIIVLSRLCLVPLGPSAAEIWALQDLLRTVEEARRFESRIDVRIVWNRFRGQTREAQDLSDGVAQTIQLPTLTSRLSYRVAYSEALARGLCTDEWLDRTAHEEISSLATEVQNILAENES